MAEQKQTTLMDKKILELTSDELGSLMKPIGLPGLPYPMAKLSKTAQGSMEHDVGVVESANNPLIMYSEQSMERINGMLFRQMPIPGMMFMLRDLLKKIEPESKNRIMTVFGDAAFGKSHLFKLVGGLVHPKGPVAVDCGGMNMRELFFRTVIDYGQGVKEQFEHRTQKGQVSQASLDTLSESFPGSVVQKDGKTFIDWDQVGKPRMKDEDGKQVAAEDRGAAMRRAAQLMKDIYDKEGIDVQSNALVSRWCRARCSNPSRAAARCSSTNSTNPRPARSTRSRPSCSSPTARSTRLRSTTPWARRTTTARNP